ncbi:50S ribosomal protein L23 [Blattabacterium cuenoti]|uniref:50S ribosomal protein L23 n=1 Tax=Blattabacterium cuenoti TaxID=1653831 RepID=UPI00163D3909|nr:50S ribosomal protein L23 [Blattabacterium cuenoti]
MILIKPFITDKSYEKEKKNIYTFSVPVNWNKARIKKEMNQIFGFSVENIHTMISARKRKSKCTKKGGLLYGKTNKIKKAIIQLNKKINFFQKEEEKKV